VEGFSAPQEIVAQRAEARSREIALLVFAGRYDEAIRLMTGRRFEVWDGGSERGGRLGQCPHPQGAPRAGRRLIEGRRGGINAQAGDRITAGTVIRLRISKNPVRAR
jgi:hypothetical protein